MAERMWKYEGGDEGVVLRVLADGSLSVETMRRGHPDTGARVSIPADKVQGLAEFVQGLSQAPPARPMGFGQEPG